MTIKTRTAQIRNNQWLLSRLDFIWTKYFSDIPQKNKVFIRFGRFAKFRMGSIKMDKKTKDSMITITSMFKNQKISQEVLDYTIGHELVHYAHGFSSPHLKLFKYPHAGGLIKKEMVSRGMIHLFRSYQNWIKNYRKKLMAARYG